MTLFIDTADVTAIKKWKDLGVIKGITTNQKIFLDSADQKRPYTKVLEDLFSFGLPTNIEIPPISVKENIDVISLREAEIYREIAQKSGGYGKNLIIKVPMYMDGRGLRLAKKLLDKKFKVNITVLMNVEQFILACNIGAHYASFFYNRIIDYEVKDNKLPQKEAGEQAWYAISMARDILEKSGTYKTRIICGSIRLSEDIENCFSAGAHIVTVTPKILDLMPFHPKSEETIREFDKSWDKYLETQRK